MKSERENGTTCFERVLELLALMGGLQILSHLQLRGKVFSDCQGLIRKISKWDQEPGVRAPTGLQATHYWQPYKSHRLQSIGPMIYWTN